MKEHPGGKSPVTLKDLAAALGYSINTVSRALRDKEDIAPATRERIQRTAREMGYINNTLAASLRLGYTNTIAVILGDVSNAHFAIMMKEIEAYARANGYVSFLLNTDEDSELERKAIQTALNKNVDGIIWCPAQSDGENLALLRETGIPFVLIGRHFEGEEVSYVVCNDELGGYQATGCLLDAGHRDILMIGGPAYISSARERLAGYRRAYAERGLAPDPALIRELPVTASDCGALLDRLHAEGVRFSAVFAFSDMLAWSLWADLQARGLRVPEDCSIVGFDHIQSRMQFPFPLTTISSYKGRMSVTSVDVLISLMREEGAAPQQIMIDTKLVEGSTVRRLEQG